MPAPTAGYFPSLKKGFPHPVPLNLWDPIGFTNKMTPERKEKALLAEVNNGARVAIYPALSRWRSPGARTA